MKEPGFDLFGQQTPSTAGPVAHKFLAPPFSVMDVSGSWWRERRAEWLALGIESEVGRSDSLTFQANAARLDHYRVQEGKRAETAEQGTSVFNPVVCEVVYRWFTRKGDVILDPFAGGSVRGVVAASLGRRYIGVDLSQKQVDANREQADRMSLDVPPEWIVGDSLDKAPDLPAADFVFSCPPYGDLERYSDDPRDLSTMDYRGKFTTAYRAIVAACVGRLRQHRFACFVTGNLRGSSGSMNALNADTDNAFRDAGADLYNELVMVAPAATGAFRAPKQFSVSRKVVSRHQRIGVYVKGMGREAAQRLGDVLP